MAEVAYRANTEQDNIGARRLRQVVDAVMDDFDFLSGEVITEYVAREEETTT